jgi:hypothetical protein
VNDDGEGRGMAEEAQGTSIPVIGEHDGGKEIILALEADFVLNGQALDMHIAGNL